MGLFSGLLAGKALQKLIAELIEELVEEKTIRAIERKRGKTAEVAVVINDITDYLKRKVGLK